jgi:ribosomal protein S18 acetylase RimI-like enzyme
MGVRVRSLRSDDRDWLASMAIELWGDQIVVGHGRTWRPAELDGFVAQDDDGQRVGVLTFEIRDDEVEVVTIDVLRRREGIGTALMLAVIERAHAAARTRMLVMTTNDNVPALGLYERLGFSVVEVREGAVAESRRIKPSIPLTGVGGTPITDEVLLELRP